LPPYDCINLIGPAGTPFFAPTNPDLDGVNITNSTINSTTIGATTPSTAAFTTATMVNQPIGNLDLCNKTYVDAAIVGISWKQPVRAATLLNITLSGAQTIDTVPVVAGDRVLVKDQSNQADNGIYIVGTPWTRSPDADTWDELVSAMVFVESGGQAGAAFYCPIQPGGTLGTTPITWSNFSVAGTYFAGTGLSLAANTFSITNTGVSAATYGSASTVPTIAVNAQGQITSATNTNIAIAGSAITSGTIDSARISGSYTGITTVGTLSGLTVSSTINGSITGNAGTATSATSATTATNLAGGAAGSLPYQSGVGATTFLAAGTNGQYLTLSSGFPAWSTLPPVGDVSGPASSTDNAIARFDSTTGKIIQNSTITLSDVGALQNVNEINFDITPASVVGGEGSLSWNSDDNTKTLELIGTNAIPLKINEEIYYRVKASSGITKGQVVMLTGTLGSSGGLLGAPATGLTAATGYFILGLAKETIALNGWGYVQAFGEVRGINTSGAPVSETWVDGDVLYYNPAVTGGLTKTVPIAPNAKVQVAAVVHADNTNGILFTRPTFEPRLNDLSDVFAPSPSNGDLIIWDSGDARWENRAGSSVAVGTATNLAGGAAGSLPYQSGAGTTTFLGIGSTGQVLKVAAGVPTWSSDASGLTIVDDTTTNATRYLTFTDATTGNITTANVSSTQLTFNPSTGSLGIGTSSPLNPIQTYKLGDYSSSSNNIRNLAYFQADTTVANSSIVFNTNPTSGQNLRGFQFPYQSSVFHISRFHTDKTTGVVNDFTIDASGNVGIGTSSPTAYGAGYVTLDVNGTTQGTIQCEANGTPQVVLYGSTTEGGVGTLTNIPFRFVTNNTERMRLDTSGNLQFNSGYGSVATAYGCRAWVNFNGTATSNLTGTYSQTGTTVTVTITAHGYTTGQAVFLDFTSGTAVDGAYTVTVIDANTFTVTQASRTTSGNVTSVRSTIRASGNVSSVADNAVGDYTVNFTNAMPDTEYSILGFARSDGTSTASSYSISSNSTGAKTTSQIQFYARFVNPSTSGNYDSSEVNIAIFR
jgi:hypothetical protein